MFWILIKACTDWHRLLKLTYRRFEVLIKHHFCGMRFGSVRICSSRWNLLLLINVTVYVDDILIGIDSIMQSEDEVLCHFQLKNTWKSSIYSWYWSRTRDRCETTQDLLERIIYHNGWTFCFSRCKTSVQSNCKCPNMVERVMNESKWKIARIYH